MGGQIPDLQDAGFSDEEIGAWAANQRQDLSQAGFSDKEIDAWLTGVDAPKKLPNPLVSRISAAKDSASRVFSALGEGFKEGYGSEPTGLSPESEEWLAKSGIFRDPATGRGGPIRFMSEALARPLASAVDAFTRLPGAVVGGLAGGAGQAVQEAGASEATGQSLKRDLNILGQVGLVSEGAFVPEAAGRAFEHGVGSVQKQVDSRAQTALLSSSDVPLVRTEIGPTGIPVDLPVGQKPTGMTFVDSGRAIAGETSPLVEQKLLRLYEDHGFHPSEVVHDAQTDPTVAQALLSQTRDELPQRYLPDPAAQAEQSSVRAMGSEERPQTAEEIAAARTQQAIADDVATKLRATGMPEDQVQANASVVAARYVTRAERMGLDAEELYRDTGLDVARREVAEGEPAESPTASYLQGDDEIPRGRIALADNQAAITLFRSADASTFMHEAAHLWLDEMARDAVHPDAPSQVRNDFRTVLDWLGARDASEITVDHHEQWAQAFERYLYDGKAPSSRLQRVFDQFADWLRSIYQSITGAGQEVPPEIKGVMDRLLATDEEIKNRDLVPQEGAGGGAGGEGGPPALPPWDGALGPAREPREPGTEMSLDEARRLVEDRISTNEDNWKPAYTPNDLYTDVVDKLFPLSQAVDKTVGRKNIPTWSNPYVAARLFAGVMGKVEHFLEHGTIDFKTGLVNGKSFRAILAPVKNDLRNFTTFIVSARAAELENVRGIATGIDMEAARKIVYDGQALYGPVLRELVDYSDRVSQYLRDAGVLAPEGYEAMQQMNRYYVPMYRVLGDGMEVRVGRFPGESFQAKNPIHNIEGSLKRVVNPLESIVRNTSLYLAMAEKNVVGTLLVDMLNGIDEAAGREPVEPGAAPIPKALVPVPLEPRGPVDASLTKWLDDQNVSAPEDMVDALRAFAEEESRTDTVTVFRNGKKEVHEVGDTLARAFKGLDAESSNFIIRALAAPTRLLLKGAVTVPDFAFRHMIRDFNYANTTGPNWLGPKILVESAIGLMMKDKDFWAWKQAGGSGTAFASLDRRYLQSQVDKYTDQTGLLYRAWNVLGDPESSALQKAGAVGMLPFQMVGKYAIHPLQMLTEFAENNSHFAAYKKRLAQIQKEEPVGSVNGMAPTNNGALSLEAPIGTDLADAGNESPTTGAPNADWSTPAPDPDAATRWKRQIQDAAFTSRDTAVDAARMGAKMHSANALVAFANITVQDTDRIIRAWKDNPMRTFAGVALTAIIPSALLWLATKDAVDSKGNNIRDTTPTWEKDLFWIVPTWPGGPTYRLPKSFGMGVVFASGTERVLDYFFGHKPDAFSQWGKSVIDTVVPSFIPTFAVPMVEQFANRSLFTNRTLIPENLEKGVPAYQQSPYTTQVARMVGRIIGAFPGVQEASLDPSSSFQGLAKAVTSPMLIENSIRAWTGNLGTYVLNATDYGLRKAGVLPDPPMPAWTLADIPFVRAFVVRYPNSSPQQIQDFEDMYARDQAYLISWKNSVADGDTAAMSALQAAGGPAMFAKLDATKQTITVISQSIRNIYKNPDMSPNDKRQQIDQLYYQLIQVGQAGATTLRQLHELAPKETTP